MELSTYHIPALLTPAIESLRIHPDGVYVDCTYGGGGHSGAIMSELTGGMLYAFDQDIQALERAPSDPRLTLIHGNFRYLSNYLRFHGVEKGHVDGILADLGVSFHHFDDASRGFSFRFDGHLDMRMNQSSATTAATLIAATDEDRLSDILYLYGELKNSRKLAHAICARKEQSPLTTVAQLMEAIKPHINPRQEKKELAQVFQALRIAVNDELASLRQLLHQAAEMLRPGGRLAIITYHSLEDRLVKNFMKTGNIEGQADTDFFGRNLSKLKMLSGKPVVPGPEEVASNPRSRSAKLRVAEKL